MFQTEDLENRLRVLTEGAKYDVSCSSSGSARGTPKGKDDNRGSTGRCHIGGLCHSFTADGRCISLLKLLMTNHCEYDCLYCVNRRSNNVERARLTPDEICGIVMGFYKRNYIEGLFLSSAVERSPEHTMQKITETLILLRTVHQFKGYIHVKAIPGAAPSTIEKAACYADRMSVNIELPSETSLKLLAPQKKKDMIVTPMRQLAGIYLGSQGEAKGRAPMLPAGQTTQMIIGASRDTDGQIIRLSQALYHNFGLKRVYYSAYVPVNEHSNLPAVPPDLRRENRLYQADWLLRFYGFNAEELVPPDYNLPSDVDPKCDWALRNIDRFPVEVNTASYEMLLRVPGIGVSNAYRIVQARKHTKLTFDSLKKMRVVLKRAQFFITADGKYMGLGQAPALIRSRIAGLELPALPPSSKYTQLTMGDLVKSGTGQL